MMEPWLSRKKGDSITHELPAKIFLQKRCRISRGKSRENFKDSVSNCKLVVQSKSSVCCKYPRQYFCKSSIMYSLAAVKAYRALRGVSSGSKWYALRIITSKASRVTSSRTSSRVWPSRKSPGNVEVWCRGLNPAENHLEGLGNSKTVRQTNYFASSDPHHDISKQLVDTTFVWSFCHGTFAQLTIPIISFTWQVLVHVRLSNRI